MGRYISADEVQEHLELDPLNETDEPKLSTVNKWVNGSEDEVDSETSTRWDLHKVEEGYQILKIICENIDILDFSLNIEKRTYLLDTGYELTNSFLKKEK